MLAVGFSAGINRPLVGAPSGYTSRVYETVAQKELMVAEKIQGSATTESTTYAVNNGSSDMVSGLYAFKAASSGSNITQFRRRGVGQ